ncbi:MAG: lysophospholipase [Chitinophagaceae bacterium]|nr:lysophospholipase [Chitinophagaceae bacterium]
MKKKLLLVLQIVLILYVLIGIFFYSFQRQFLFQATPIASDSTYTFSTPYKEQYIQFDSVTKLDIIQFQPVDTPKGIVLYFHGNRDNIGHYAKFAASYTNQGYETWMIDYPGYGKSTGELTEEGLYELALQLYKLARKKFEPNQIIIYGKSIGTGIATQLASIRDCNQLILETPYYSIPSMLSTYFWMYPLQLLLHYKLPTYTYLPKVTAPVTIFHGTADELIDYENALQLKKFLKPSDQFITIEGGMHNNLNEFPLMQVKLKELLK